MTDKSILSCAIVALLAALVGSATVAGVIQKQRNDLNLVVKMEGVEGMPPHVAVVTAALGTCGWRRRGRGLRSRNGSAATQPTSPRVTAFASWR